MIVIVAALGMRSALLVGLAVPGSFLAGLLVLGMLGLTVNIVVLFGLIFAVGMLVDGATVIVEYADRKMAEGMHRREAYRRAAKRMAWPVAASIATTLAAFLPLLFWPGVVGEFMKYLPITLVATLAGLAADGAGLRAVDRRVDRQARGERSRDHAAAVRRRSAATSTSCGA